MPLGTAVAVPGGYVAALLVTLLVEVPVYGWGLGRRGVVAGVVANLVSHPLIFVVLPVSAVAGEPIAWAVEAAITVAIVRRPWLRCVLVVLLANAASLLVGAAVLR